MKATRFNSKRRQSTRMFVLLFFMFFLAGGVYAQVSPEPGKGNASAAAKSGKIRGKVVDADSHEAMEYANVSIYGSQDSKLITGGISNGTGGFEINQIPFGNYKVEVNFVGYNKITLNNVSVKQDNPVVNLGTISLKSSSQQIGAVNVVAERNRLEYKIDKKVINVASDINSAGGTAVTVLENTPSVEVDIDGNVSLRGSSNFTVLIDGKPSVLSGSDALKQIPSSAIQNIEIITNPSAKYDPDGMAGIINVVMKKNVISGFNGVVNANLGTGKKYGTDMLLNYKTKKYNLFLGTNLNDNTDYGSNRSTRETYSNDTTTYLITRGRRDMTRSGRQLKGGIDYYLSDKTSFTVSSEIGHYGFNAYGGGNLHNYDVPGTFDIYSVQKDNTIRNGHYVSGDASFQTRFDKSGAHKLEGSFDFRHRNGKSNETNDEYLSDPTYAEQGDYLSQVITDDHSKSDDYRMKLDYSLPLKEGAKFEAGLQSRIEGEREFFNFMNYDTASHAFINNPLYTSDMDYKENIHSVYSTYSGKLTGIQYQLGLRGEYTNRSIEDSKAANPYVLNRFDIFPSAHFSFGKSEFTQYMASYSRRINRPDGRDLDPFPGYINQYTIRTGNPGLKPEYTDSYELSCMKKFGGSFVSLETFFRTTKDLMTHIQELKDDGIFYMTVDNLNRDYSLGGELMVNMNLSNWFILNTSFSLYNYRLKGEVLGASVDKQSTNYTGRLNATIKLAPDSRFQLTSFYHGPSVSAQGDQKGMLYTNLSFRQDFMKKKLTATASVRDLFGTMKMAGTSLGDDFKSTFKWTRQPRVLMLTLSYKINSYKMGENSREDQPDEKMDDMY